MQMTHRWRMEAVQHTTSSPSHTSHSRSPEMMKVLGREEKGNQSNGNRFQLAQKPSRLKFTVEGERHDQQGHAEITECERN